MLLPRCSRIDSTVEDEFEVPVKTEQMATRHIAIDEDTHCYYLQCTVCRNKQTGAKPLAIKRFLSAIVSFTRKHQKCVASRDA